MFLRITAVVVIRPQELRTLTEELGMMSTLRFCYKEAIERSAPHIPNFCGCLLLAFITVSIF